MQTQDDDTDNDVARCPAHPGQAGAPVWCPPCRDRITTQLRRIPNLAGELALRGIADGGRLAATGESGRTNHTKISGSPSGSPAWDAADELITWAHATEDALRAHLNHAHAARAVKLHGTTAARVLHLGGSIKYLTTWVTALLSAPFAEQAGRDILTLTRRAERAAGLDRLIHHLPAPCPSCDTLALVRQDGAEQVDCKACGRSWTEPDYRRLVLVIAGDYQDITGAHR